MAHLLTPPSPIAKPISTRSTKKTQLQVLGSQRVLASQIGPNEATDDRNVLRRAIILGLGSAAMGLSVGGDHRASAARRPPPPPVDEKKEKKDPNVSGVLAKVLASKKRKEAMKESVAKLREKGKAIEQAEPSE